MRQFLRGRTWILLLATGWISVAMTSCGKRDEGVTELMKAAKEGDLARVEDLVTSGSEVNAESTYHWTPLMFASVEGHLDVVSALLDAGAEVDHVSTPVSPEPFATRGGYYPTTALAEAIKYKHDEVATLLMEHSKTIHPIDLVEAAKREGDQWLKRLVERGGDPAATTDLSFQGSPLCAAASEGHLENVRWLVMEQGVDVDQRVNGTNALEQAVRNDHVELVEFLLQQGADSNAAYEDSTMPTILLVAVKKYQSDSRLGENLKVIEALLDHGADPDLIPDYSVFGLGIIGEGRNAKDVARAKVEEYREYYLSATDAEWKAKSQERLQHRENVVALLVRE